MTAVAGDGYEGPVAGYTRRVGGTRDELLDPLGDVHPASRDLAASIDLLGRTGLLVRRRQTQRFVEDDGITYGPDGPGRDWALDPLPVVIPTGQWAALRAGLAQRAELLDAVLADLYGPRVLLREGVVPPEVVFTHPEFLRPADRIRLPGRHQLVLSATDLARDADGAWRVLGDGTQAPSGAGYAMANRRVVSRVLPGLHRDIHPAPLRGFFDALRASLQEAAPATAEAPRVVVLSPGPGSETAFDQAFLATILGYPLVTGEDLTVRDGRVRMRSVGREEPVDAILRRVDSWFCDPLDLRPDSRLGVPGLLEAARRGTVSVVNPIGAGVLENAALMPFLAAACRLLLGAAPLLDTVTTYWCGDPRSRRRVISDLGSLVVKPVARGADLDSVFGWELGEDALAELRRRIEAQPWAWCGQEPLEMSTAPVVTDDGLEARHLVLRTFTVAQGGGYRLMEGGLLRVSGRPGSRLVSSMQGGLAKDLWVVLPEQAAEPGVAAIAPSTAARLAVAAAAPALAPRAAEDLFWLGRYAERAEDTARLLRVVAGLVDDYGSRAAAGPGSRALRALLVALTHVTTTHPGFTTLAGGVGPVPGPHHDLVALIADVHRPGTLGFAVRRTIEAAHAVREQMSGDTWLVVGALDRVLDGVQAQAAEVVEDDQPALQTPLARILEGLLALAGLGAESMVRDTGWHFLDLGRRIERALQVLALLRATLVVERGPAVDALVLEAVVTAGESVITFRRRNATVWQTAPGAGVSDRGGGAGHAAGVLDLLLLDTQNPRAVAHQLDRIVDDLAAVGGPAGAVAVDQALRSAAARLREADPVALVTLDGTGGTGTAGGTVTVGGTEEAGGGYRSALAALLDALTADLSELSRAVAAAHFGPPAQLRPLPPPTPGWTA